MEQIRFEATCPQCGRVFVRTCDRDLITDREAAGRLSCFGPCPDCKEEV
jgi:hypothetical protein